MNHITQSNEVNKRPPLFEGALKLAGRGKSVEDMSGEGQSGRDIKRIYFVGIGGSSMNGLARIMHDLGCFVSGSDRERSDTTDMLLEYGIHVDIGHRPDNIYSPDLVVYTAAVAKDNPEIVEARRLGIETIERSSLLGMVESMHRKSIAVAGTHGKTTTTAMIAMILISAGFDPTVHLGGNLDILKGGVRSGSGGYFVTEACEYVDTFLKLHPDIAVILNIEPDHLDYFKDIDQIKNSFRQFASQVKNGGTAVICADDLHAPDISPHLKCRVSAYGLSGLYGTDPRAATGTSAETASLPTEQFTDPGHRTVPCPASAATGPSTDTASLTTEQFTDPGHRTVPCPGIRPQDTAVVPGHTAPGHRTVPCLAGHRTVPCLAHCVVEWSAGGVSFDDMGRASFDLLYKGVKECRIKLNVPGQHNVLNAIAAAAACRIAGAPGSAVAEGLSLFRGVHRRFEYKGLYNGAEIYIDYAHHPTEIAATLSATSKMGRAGRRILCVFQPHTYTRTRELMDSFAVSFDGASEVVVAGIYSARETDDGSVHPATLVEKIKGSGVDAVFINDFKEIALHIKEQTKKGDIILILGAGNIIEVADMLTGT